MKARTEIWQQRQRWDGSKVEVQTGRGACGGWDGALCQWRLRRDAAAVEAETGSGSTGGQDGVGGADGSVELSTKVDGSRGRKSMEKPWRRRRGNSTSEAKLGDGGGSGNLAEVSDSGSRSGMSSSGAWDRVGGVSGSVQLSIGWAGNRGKEESGGTLKVMTGDDTLEAKTRNGGRGAYEAECIKLV